MWRRAAARRIGGDSRIVEEKAIPGPLTLRMMERVWSSMNSTRTWVTPPREPLKLEVSLDPSSQCQRLSLPFASAGLRRTGAAQNAGDLHEFDGLLRGIHFGGLIGSSVVW